MPDLSRLLAPRSIAVVGGAPAERVVAQCLKLGFNGPIWPVHPKRSDLAGVPCVPSLHDLPGVPWHRLPKVRAAAPEVYDSLVSYRSWTGLVVRYLTDPTLGPWKRVVRPDAPVADEVAA